MKKILLLLLLITSGLLSAQNTVFDFECPCPELEIRDGATATFIYNGFTLTGSISDFVSEPGRLLLEDGDCIPEEETGFRVRINVGGETYITQDIITDLTRLVWEGHTDLRPPFRRVVNIQEGLYYQVGDGPKHYNVRVFIPEGPSCEEYLTRGSRRNGEYIFYPIPPGGRCSDYQVDPLNEFDYIIQVYDQFFNRVATLRDLIHPAGRHHLNITSGTHPNLHVDE